MVTKHSAVIYNIILQMEAEHCMLLAVPHGRDSYDFIQQQNSLRNGIINYLIMKQAAGIVNVSAPGTHQVSQWCTVAIQQ